jgi:hypothetical protein
MAREPYDYRLERRIAAWVLTVLIFGTVGVPTVSHLPVDLGALSIEVGALFGVVGLGRLIRSLRG